MFNLMVVAKEQGIHTSLELLFNSCLEGSAFLQLQSMGIFGMEEAIAVCPLGVGDGQEAGHQPSGPLVSCAAGATRVVVCSLERAPMSRDVTTIQKE